MDDAFGWPELGRLLCEPPRDVVAVLVGDAEIVIELDDVEATLERASELFAVVCVVNFVAGVLASELRVTRPLVVENEDSHASTVGAR